MRMKTIFTHTQVAEICKVAPSTVCKWFDSGRLRGYRVPGSQERRIPREHLVRFMKEHGMPLGELDDECKTACLVTDDVAWASGLISKLSCRENQVVRYHPDPSSSRMLRLAASLAQPGRLIVVLDVKVEALPPLINSLREVMAEARIIAVSEEKVDPSDIPGLHSVVLRVAVARKITEFFCESS